MIEASSLSRVVIIVKAYTLIKHVMLLATFSGQRWVRNGRIRGAEEEAHTRAAGARNSPG